MDALQQLCDEIYYVCVARHLLLIDKYGRPILASGANPDVDQTSLASLAAAGIAASQAMVQLSGGNALSFLSHETDNVCLLLHKVGGAILLMVLNDNQSLGWAKFQVRKRKDLLLESLTAMEKATTNAESPLNNASDEEIEGLFYGTHQSPNPRN